MRSPLELTREQVLAFRRRVGSLVSRLPAGSGSLRRAAYAGLQDSMPRAALLSIHARMKGTAPTILDDASLVQIWGPRFNVYVVSEVDHPIFTLGRSPDDTKRRDYGEQMADALEDLLGGGRMTMGDASRALGPGDHNRLRYAAPTGRVLIRWDGARQPEIWTVPRPDVDPRDARLELARRHLHAFGPTTPVAFGDWAGIKSASARTVYNDLTDELEAVRTPIGEAYILASDEDEMVAGGGPEAPARLLPSGDAYYLLHGAERELLVPEEARRNALWTSRVWPGAVLADGHIVGTWRRSQAKVAVDPWQKLSAASRRAIEAEAALLPLPGVEREIVVGWLD